MRSVRPNPGELVSAGRFNLGAYKEPFTDINPLDADIKGFLPRARWFRWLRLKEWQHFALVNDNYYISLALFNAKVLAFAQVCVHHRREGTLLSVERKTPPWSITLPGALFDGRATYEGRGFHLSSRNLLGAGCHRIRFELEPQDGLPAIKGRFQLEENLTRAEPMVVCLPLAGGRAIYTHKFICCMQGQLTIGDQAESFDDKSSYGLIDIHKGYYPRIMQWQWATGGGFIGRQRIGFNLTDNQVEDQENHNENCIWIDGRLHLLPPVHFEFTPQDPMQPWQIQDREGMVDLHFTPAVTRRVDINLLAIANRYRAPFGSFTGSLKTKAGESIQVRDFYGMCEDMYLKA